MQIYALRMQNFFRFREDNNSIVFDLTDSQRKSLETKTSTLDKIYDEVLKNPAKHIEQVKQDNCLVNLSGISGVLGDNFDRSNGAGKSTVMEAICYGLYDHIVRKNVNTDKTSGASISVVTRINGIIPSNVTECFVELLFEEQGRIYRVKRIRRFSKSHKSHSPDLEFECINSDTNDGSEASHRTSNTNEAILEAINMDYEVFVNSVMFGQNDAGQFLTGTDKIRKEMLVRLLHLEGIVNGCLEAARKRKNEKDKEVEKLRAQIDIIKENIEQRQSKDDIEKSIKDIEQQISISTQKLESNTKKISELEKSDILKKAKDMEDKSAQLKKDIDCKKGQKNDQISEWLKLKSEVANRIESQQKRIVNGKTKIAEIKTGIDTLQKSIDSFDMASCKDSLEKVSKAKEMKPTISERLDLIKKERENKVIANTKLQVEIDRLNKEITPLKQQLQQAISGEFVCDKCKSIVSRDHIESLLKDASSKLSEFTETIKNSESEINAISEKITNGNSKLNQINEWLIKEGAVLNQIQSFENNKKRIEELKKQYEEAMSLLKEIEADIEKMQKQQTEYQDKIVSVNKQYDDDITKLESEIKALSENIAKINQDASQLVAAIRTLKHENDLISQSKAQYDSKIGSLKKEIETLLEDQKKVEDLTVKMAEGIKILNRLIVLDDVFGLEGIQTRIVNKYLPLLNVFVKDFLDILSNGEMAIQLFVNDKSKVDIEIRGNSGENFNMLSGGEKELARLSVAIGLALLSFSRSASKPEIICLDEIFGSLDDDRIKSVFRLLNKLKDKFSRVLVISHNSEINERLSHQILIEKSPGDIGISKIKNIS